MSIRCCFHDDPGGVYLLLRRRLSSIPCCCHDGRGGVSLLLQRRISGDTLLLPRWPRRRLSAVEEENKWRYAVVTRMTAEASICCCRGGLKWRYPVAVTNTAETSLPCTRGEKVAIHCCCHGDSGGISLLLQRRISGDTLSLSRNPWGRLSVVAEENRW